MRRSLAFMAALALMGAPQHAFAQYQAGETGALPKRNVGPATIDGEGAANAREATVELAACILRLHEARAKKAVQLPADSKAFVKTLTTIATDRCLDFGELRIPPLLLRAALFEQLYEREFGAGTARDLSKVPAINYMQGYELPLSETSKRAIAMALVGDCLVRADTNAARLMVMSRPGNSREDQATGALAARLPSCIPQGQTIKFSRTFIRAAVSEALYRLSSQAVTADPPAGGSDA